MKIQIPKRFEIFGLTFTVKQLKKLGDEDHWGDCSIANKAVRLKSDLNGEQKEITYLHEITHAILDCLEYIELSKDEAFVERFSKALHQVLKTSK